MTTKTIRFLAEKETPGAVRYEEINGAGDPVPKGEFVIGKVYVRKDAFEGPSPAEFTMTIDY